MNFFNRFFRSRSSTNNSGNENGTTVELSGGDGSSIENAILIHTDKSMLGVYVEYAYLSEIHGEKNKKWELISQELIEHNGKHYDVMHIKVFDLDREMKYYFDISNFYEK